MKTKEPSQTPHIIVIGAGISGLTVARLLQEAHFKVTVLEKEDQCGGLIKCKNIDGNLFHVVGGHVFNSKVQPVLDWFWGLFDKEKEFIKAKRKAAILLHNKVVGYPIENFIYELPEDKVINIVDDLLKLSTKGGSNASDNFEDFLLYSFGKTLYDLYFGPYNRKIWQRDLSTIPLPWLEGKLPMPTIKNILLSNIQKKEESEMVHASFYYPIKGGSQFIIDRLAEGLTIQSSYEVLSIKKSENRILINNGEMSADYVIYCGDIRRLKDIVDVDDDNFSKATEAIKHLPSNGTTNALCETDDTDVSWLYLPEVQFKAHRIIYTGNFSPSNNANAEKKTCVVEFSGKQSLEVVKEEIKLLPGNLKMLAYNYQPNSYIIHQSNTNEDVAVLKERLSQHNIALLGRFAEWQYFNMDKCIESAMNLSKRIIEQYAKN